MSEIADIPFRVRVIEQGFAEPHPETDWIVGGSIELVIAGVQLLGPDEDEIGISKTALQLSRTLTEDHVAEDMTTYLVMHDPGCCRGPWPDSGQGPDATAPGARSWWWSPCSSDRPLHVRGSQGTPPPSASPLGAYSPNGLTTRDDVESLSEAACPGSPQIGSTTATMPTTRPMTALAA